MTLRDIIQRHNVSRPQACMHTLRALLSSISRPMTMKSLHDQVRDAGHLVSRETVCDYLRWGEDALAFFAVPIFSASLKNQEHNYSKIYAVDWALANCNSPVWDGSLSRAFENAVYLHLRRRWSRVNYCLTRSERQEIDFVPVDTRGTIQSLVQACLTISDPQTRAREIAPLVAAAKYFGVKECLIVTRSAQEALHQEGVTIRVVPAWRWLLE